MHRVKGLEFDYVILLSANKGLILWNSLSPIPVIRFPDSVRKTTRNALVYVSMNEGQYFDLFHTAR